MIDSLNGEVISIGLDHAVVECGGVGYRFLAAPPMLGTLTRGETRRILTAMTLKDDGVTLYGFVDEQARSLFRTLQTVTGLGPKLALACLSVYEPATLGEHISAGDTKAIQAIPGVGKKMAERIALELRDKVAGLYTPPGQPGLSSSSSGSSPAAEQVIEALVGLGFSDRAARSSVDGVTAENPQATSAQLLRTALNQLGKK
ncbi:Holliday junction ATP-dependent DNA helicase RuvA [Corynebacterium capitovis DSM 44611]|uniref:Holliday junction branch migration protein RuvA n=1 Tax=Corynebacterium capitovis TaxID=131081 RepID=UPI00036C4946|nr:Holliday junction branch migration protein RuvA [Corynebacterium capitovis]WKD57558.1 Holliday junction ATP-dependent DNA helicase RuvA [Corynebacterium capitovis DSM 44611]